MTDQDTKDIFKLLPITLYKRNSNIRIHLVRSLHRQPTMFSDVGTHSSKRRRRNNCIFVTNGTTTHMKVPRGSINVTETLIWITRNIVYGIIYKRCHIIYIGETVR